VNSVSKLFLLKHIGLLLVVFSIAIGLLQIVVSENPSNTCLSNNNVIFYAYGESTCPHCRNLHDFFDTTFKHNYIFCYIDKYSECYRNLGKSILDIAKLPGAQSIQSVLGYVPQTYILKNNTYLLGIVIGEVKDEAFWLNLACREPSSEIPVYHGMSQVGVIEANTTLQGEIVQEILSYIPPAETTGIPSELVLGIIVIAVLTVSIGGYLAYTHISSKKTSKYVKRSGGRESKSNKKKK